MHKKKVAIVINTAWNLFNFRLNLARSIKNAGHDVVLIAPYDSYSEILKKEFAIYDIYISNKGTNPKQDIKTSIQFYQLYKQLKPDIVLQYTIKPNIYGTIACHLLGIKSINNIAGLGTLFINQGFVTKIAKLLYKFSQARASKIFFQNNDDFKLFTEERLVDAKKCSILPGSGVDLEKFKPVEHNKKDNIFRFLLVSRMLWDKGIKEYVEAAAIIKKQHNLVEFQLLGFLDVENKSAISKQQMELWTEQGYVNYLGVSDQVQKEIAQADCIVLPSFYREGTPRTLLESASMAKPIVTTDNVGCRDVVDHGVNGFLCNKRDTQDLVEKLEMMLTLSEEDRIEMGRKGREKMQQQFDEKIVIDKYLHEIQALLSTN